MPRVKKIDTSKLPSRDDAKRLPGLPAEILIPSGRCPAKLTAVNKSAIKKWMEEVDSHLEEWETMNESGYCYWLRESLNIFSADYAQACLIVKEHCSKRDAKMEKLLREAEKQMNDS